MANFARVTVLGIGALAAIALSGCVGGPPAAVVTPAPSESPVFASEEEALAAATEAYAAYLEVSDMVANDGGTGANRLAESVSADYLVEQSASYAEFEKGTIRTVGSTSFQPLAFQSMSKEGGVAAYVCVDVSSVRLLDDAGQDVTPADRAIRYPLVVEFEGRTSDLQSLVVSGSLPWTGESFCTDS